MGARSPHLLNLLGWWLGSQVGELCLLLRRPFVLDAHEQRHLLPLIFLWWEAEAAEEVLKARVGAESIEARVKSYFDETPIPVGVGLL